MNGGVNTAFNQQLTPARPGLVRAALAGVALAVAGAVALRQRAPHATQPAVVTGIGTRSSRAADTELAPLPGRLSQTGLYRAGSSTEIAPDHLPYAPQYPLWSDGASKRRWIWLPPGTQIDASDPDRWQFPIGTRFWKEFSFGERTETRYLERLSDARSATRAMSGTRRSATRCSRRARAYGACGRSAKERATISFRLGLPGVP